MTPQDYYHERDLAVALYTERLAQAERDIVRNPELISKLRLANAQKPNSLRFKKGLPE